MNNEEVAAFLYDEPILKYRLANEATYASLEILPIKFDLQFYAFAFSDQHDEMNKIISQKILEYTEGMEWRLLLAEYDLSEFYYLILLKNSRFLTISKKD